METELLAAADPARAIVEAAERHDADVVIVEAPGEGLRARLRGRRLARRVRRLVARARLHRRQPRIGTEDLMFDVASIAIAAACLLVAFSFIYLFDRV